MGKVLGDQRGTVVPREANRILVGEFRGPRRPETRGESSSSAVASFGSGRETCGGERRLGATRA